MEQYIDKAKVVAEIEKRRSEWLYGSSIEAKYKREECDDILSSLNTIEVKEVDFEREFDNYTKDILACDVQFEPFTHLYNCAKYFFELGLKAKKGGDE